MYNKYKKSSYQKFNNGKYELLDDYDHFKNKTKEVLDLIKSENNITKDTMSDMTSIQNNIYYELKNYLVETYSTYPIPNKLNGWDSKYLYYIKYEKGKSFPIYCRKNINEEILLDENLLSKDKPFFNLSNFTISKDHKLMCYGLDLKGDELFELKIINIDSKKEIKHNIPKIQYSVYILINNTIYYLKSNSKNRLFELYKYDLNTKTNKKLYEEPNEKYELSIDISNDNKYLFLNIHSFNNNEIYYVNLITNEMKLFLKRKENHLYSIVYNKNSFYIVTNKDESVNFKIMYCNENDITNWKDYIKYDKNVNITNLIELKNYLLIEFKVKGINYVRIKNETIDKVIDKKNVFVYEIGSYDSDHILLEHNSLNTPFSLFKFNLTNNKIKLVYQKQINNYNKDDYYFNTIYVKNYEVEVPISIIYKKNLFKKGKNPLYLYGYGAYGLTIEQEFDFKILPLLNKGFVYAIAHVRGGSFLGKSWYDDGKLLNKMNSFNDFIKCAEFLIKENYTYKNGITIEGRSAGGLLVGASSVMRPDLFRGVIAGVPFVDVLNTLNDKSLPLTIQEYDQWGDPNDEEYFKYIRKYCPYYNIKSNNYPNYLITGGLNDPRVPYWEPLKFGIKLKEHNKSKDNLILIKIDNDSGHFGNFDRYKYLDEVAFKYSFVIKLYDDLRAIFLNKFYFFNKKKINFSKLELNEGSLGISSDKYGSKLLIDLIKLHMKKSDITITDMTANVGVDSIALGLFFKKVNSIELSKKLFSSLNNNINIYGLKNVKTYNGSSVEIIKNLKQDIIYIDAPWGGEDYHKNNLLKLYLDDKELSQIYNMFKSKTKLFILKLPKNYDINNFIKETQVNGYFLYPHIRKDKIKYIFMIIRS